MEERGEGVTEGETCVHITLALGIEVVHPPEYAVANCITATRIYPVLPKAFFITSWYERQPKETPTDTRMYSVYSVIMATSSNRTTPTLNPASLMAAGRPMSPDPIMELIMLKDAPTMPLAGSVLLEPVAHLGA